jgi:hypothetical protein
VIFFRLTSLRQGYGGPPKRFAKAESGSYEKRDSVPQQVPDRLQILDVIGD